MARGEEEEGEEEEEGRRGGETGDVREDEEINVDRDTLVLITC